MGSKNQCRRWNEKILLLGRKAMTNLDRILKAETSLCQQRAIHIVTAMVFPVVLHWCESWTIRKAECQRTDAFELCWRRLLRVWPAGRWNQSILREINPECSLEGLTLKLKLQYFGLLIWRPDSLEKPLMLGKIEVMMSISRWMDKKAVVHIHNGILLSH